jgi:hypothetical protein
MFKKDSLDAPLDYEKVEDSPLLPPQQQDSSGFQSLHQDDGLDRKEWVHSEHCILCSFVSCVYRGASFLVHTVAPDLVGLANTLSIFTTDSVGLGMPAATSAR